MASGCPVGCGYRTSAPSQKVLVDSGQTPPLHFSPPAFLPLSEATETEIVNDKISNYLPVPKYNGFSSDLF